MQDESQVALVQRLIAEFALPPACVLSREEERRPYECDGLSVYRELPLLVVLPETVEQVQRVLRVCSQLEVPVVARGAGTGLSGGALPLANGVLQLDQQLIMECSIMKRVLMKYLSHFMARAL